MPKSMTGYGRAITQGRGWAQSWEIKSVNGRHLDIKWRLPNQARPMEMELERTVRKHAKRGRVNIQLHLQITAPELMGVNFNKTLARAMLDQVGSLAKDMDYTLRPDFARLMGMSFLWDDDSSETDPDLARGIREGLSQAIDDWNASRAKEGQALQEDLAMRLGRLEDWLARLRKRAPAIKEEKAETLKERIEFVLERHKIEPDESRMMQEIAILSDKLDVSEELTRLSAHLERLGELVAAEGDVGKKLDFVLQECFREINTCGNKSQDTEVSRIVVDFKAELEKCREQVQNIE